MIDQFVILYLHSPREHFFGKVLALDSSGVCLRAIPLDQVDAFKYQVKREDQSVFFQTGFYPLYRVERMIKDEPQGELESVLEDIIKTSNLTEEEIRKI